jgi:hypothetical protein
MAAGCLSCAAPLVIGRRCAAPPLVGQRSAGKAAGHLLAMSSLMILIHLVVLTLPGHDAHHGTATPSGAEVLKTHNMATLALMGVELLCLMAASAALRLSRRKTPARAFSTTGP